MNKHNVLVHPDVQELDRFAARLSPECRVELYKITEKFLKLGKQCANDAEYVFIDYLQMKATQSK